MDSGQRSRLRRQAQSVPITAQVGKAGLSTAIVAEIRRQINDKRLLKIRLLPAVEGEDKALGEEVAAAVGAELVEVRGHTAVLWKHRA